MAKKEVPEFEWCCKACNSVQFYIVATKGVAYAECVGCEGRFQLHAFVPPTKNKREQFVMQLDKDNIIISHGDKIIVRSAGGVDGSKGK